MKHKIKIRKAERRIAQRLNIPLRLKYKWSSKKGKLEEIITQDVSGGGMRVRVNTPLKKGDRLKAQLYFPEDPKPVNVASEVIWCKKKKVKSKVYFEAGIKHIRVTPRDKERFVFLFCELMLNFLMFSKGR